MINMGGTQHLAAVVGEAWLAELEFGSGTQRLTTAPVTLTVGGQTYTGLGDLANVANVAESTEAANERLVLSLSVVNLAMLAAALGNVEDYRGRAVRLALVLLDAQYQVVGPAVPRWAGEMERVVIPRRAAELDGDGESEASGAIELHCSRFGMSRARNDQGLRLTLAQQQQRHPGDTGLRYVRTLIEQPALWLSKRFQEQ